MILLALAVVTIVSTSGCGRCRNFFRRGAHCGRTPVAATPAIIGAPLAVSAPVAAPVVSQPAICPSCQQPVTSCESCESGWIESSSACPECDSVTSFDDGYLIPEAVAPNATIQPDSGTTDPGPASNN